MEPDICVVCGELVDKFKNSERFGAKYKTGSCKNKHPQTCERVNLWNEWYPYGLGVPLGAVE